MFPVYFQYLCTFERHVPDGKVSNRAYSPFHICEDCIYLDNHQRKWLSISLGQTFVPTCINNPNEGGLFPSGFSGLIVSIFLNSLTNQVVLNQTPVSPGFSLLSEHFYLYILLLFRHSLLG